MAWPHTFVFILNFKHINHINLVFVLLPLEVVAHMKTPAYAGVSY